MGATIRHLSMKNNQRNIVRFLHRLSISAVTAVLFLCTTESFVVYGNGVYSTPLSGVGISQTRFGHLRRAQGRA